jgi:hypothetical protein
VKSAPSSKGAEKVAGWLSDFERRATPGPFSTPFVHHSPAASDQADVPHLVIGVIVQGNEFGTLPAV